MKVVTLAPDRGSNEATHTGRLSLCHHLGVTHGLQQIGNTKSTRCMQDQGGVARAAAAHVVTHIEQHHRASRRRLRL